MLHIALIYVKDKQAFTSDMLRMLGKPVDVAKKLRDEGHELIHIVDVDAVGGSSTNLDIYDKLTYFVNVEVECAPKEELVKKLLSLKCRVVLDPRAVAFDLSVLREKKLLVAKIQGAHRESVDNFHDVIIEDADDDSVKRFSAMGKRVIIYEKDKNKVKEKVWGIIEG